MSPSYDWRALAERREQHRPRDVAALAAAVAELHRQHLKPRDIADALGLDLSTVTHLLPKDPA